MLVEWVSGSSVVDKLDELADESIGLDVGLAGIIALKVQQHLGPALSEWWWILALAVSFWLDLV